MRAIMNYRLRICERSISMCHSNEPRYIEIKIAKVSNSAIGSNTSRVRGGVEWRSRRV